MSETTKERLKMAALFAIPFVIIAIIFFGGKAVGIKEFIEWSK